MTRRIKRTRNYEITLEVNSDDFISTPREAQRNWVLNRAMKEFADELEHLDRVAGTFVRGVDMAGSLDRSQAILSDDQIMEDWQIPIMQQMAHVVTQTGGRVLEVGFGRGVSATFVQEANVESHTIVECNDSVVERFGKWRQRYAERNINLIHSRWQDATDQFEQYDGILLHTYPMNEKDFMEQVVQSVTFAEHFFPTAQAHLRSGGVFTYLTGESDSLSRAHQRLLLKHFSSFEMSLAANLAVPDDTRDATWVDSMVLVRAIR